MKIKFTAPLEPVPFKRTASNGKRRFNSTRYSQFKDALGFIAKNAMHGLEPLTGAVKIHVDVYRKIAPTALNFGDADNHLKSIMDALNGICYVDDRQIVSAVVNLLKGDPLIVIELETDYKESSEI